MIMLFYKLERFLYNIKLSCFAILIRGIMRIVFSCDIPYKCKIGRNCIFPHHALGIVIHPNVIIGDNCKILHGVTIGGRSQYEEVPVIGNNVLIGANSIIIGPVKIGDNAVIGAGSVVLHNVNPGETVAGNPAIKIK